MENRAGGPSVQEGAGRPEKITDERLGNILAAVGNHEAKILTLLGMSKGSIYTATSLSEMMRERQGEKPGWIQNSRVSFNYCADSFVPIGLVAQEVIDESGTWGYMKTEEGQKTTALLGHLLNFSLQFPDTSLADILGATSSSAKSALNLEEEFKKRSPETRLRILFEIATRGQLPMREADLSEALNEKDNREIGNHLEQLREKGIISYDSKEAGEPVALYMLSKLRPPENPNPYVRSDHAKVISQTQRVYEIVRNNPDPNREWSSKDVAETLIKQYPQGEGSSMRSLTSTISGILAHLKTSNYLKGKYSYKKKSEIDLTEEQRDMIIQFLTIIDQYQDQDPEFIKSGEQLAGEILSDPVRVATLMLKAKEHSNYANRRSKEESSQDIESILTQHPGLTVREITDYLRIKQDRIIHNATVKVFIFTLFKGGSLRKEIINGVAHYSNNEEPLKAQQK